MPSAHGSATRLAPLVLIGAVLPAIFVALNTWLLTTARLPHLMAALVGEVGLLGPLCVRFVRPPWLMWLVYAWIWLVMELMVLALAISDPYWGLSITSDTLPVSILSGQLGLVLVWAALGQMRWNIRWPAAFLLAVLILVPIALHYPPPTALLILVFLQSAMLLAVCEWLAFTGFRLVRVNSTSALTLPTDGRMAGPAPHDSQFQLRDLLLWTTTLAIALAIARAINYWSTSFAIWEHIQSIFATRGTWDLFSIFSRQRTWDFLLDAPTAAILTAAVLLIALWASLGRGHAALRWTGLIILIGGLAIAHGLIDYYHHAWVWRWAPPLWHAWDAFYNLEHTLIVWHCLTAGMLFAALLTVRTLGYRLCRVKRNAPDA
jgi:hypothetical protein